MISLMRMVIQNYAVHVRCQCDDVVVRKRRCVDSAIPLLFLHVSWRQAGMLAQHTERMFPL